MNALDRTQSQLNALTQRIHLLMQQARQQILEIGDCLRQVKMLLPHGEWLDWLTHEFAWSARTARRLMSVAERFKLDTVSDLPIDPSALYILAAPSTPPGAVEEALTLARQGQAISPTTARQLRDSHRDPPTPRVPARPTPPSPELHFFDDVPMDDFNPTPPAPVIGDPSAWADTFTPSRRWVLVELEPGLPATEGEALATQLRLRRGVVRWAEAFPSSGHLIDALDDREDPT